MDDSARFHGILVPQGPQPVRSGPVDDRGIKRSGKKNATASRGISSWNMGLTIGGFITAGLVMLVGVYLGVGHYLPHKKGAGLSVAQQLTAAFAAASALGAIVALVVNVRRQDLQERRQTLETDAAFTDRFREAARQLGAAAPAERIAGVYAMASLTDDYPDRAQQCVDVLCGYLRLPYDPKTDDLDSRTTDRIVADGVTIRESTATRPYDTQIRYTIVAVIRSRTQDATSPWTGLNYDFTGARLHNLNLSGSQFSSGRVSFNRATFSGEAATLGGATFSGKIVSFERATFSGDVTRFGEATFSGEMVSFERATFASTHVNFARATFSGWVSFSHATFSGEEVTFNGATFSGLSAAFAEATFSGQRASFFDTTFSSSWVSFAKATFSGEHVSFLDTTFSGSRVSFEQAKYDRVLVRFDRAVSPDGILIWGLNGANLLNGAAITYGGAPFEGQLPRGSG